MALLQQHDGLRDILIEPAARRRAARGHSELEAQSGRENQPACLFSCCLHCVVVLITYPFRYVYYCTEKLILYLFSFMYNTYAGTTGSLI